MIKLNANISMLFQELEVLERLSAASNFGFNGVELLFPYAFDKDIIRENLDKNNLKMILFNMPPGDWESGERGMACDPNRITEFQDSTEIAIKYAETLNCKKLHCMAGIKPRISNLGILTETYKKNLKFAAHEAQKKGIQILIEPINNIDIPEYYLNYSSTGLAILNELNIPNLMLQYDIYHMQIMEGNLAKTIKENINKIGHFQLADTPGRHEPGTGEINFNFLLPFIDSLGYSEWIGCEYLPKTTTIESLKWTKQFM